VTYGLCADIHAHKWSLFSKSVDDEGDVVNSRLKSIMSEFDRLCEETRLAGGNRVYIAGDLFHVRGNLNTSVLNYVMLRMRRSARKNDLQIIIMPGNHDLEDAEITWVGNAVQTLDDAGDHDLEDQLIRVVAEPTFIEQDMVAVVPWQNTREGLLRSIDEIAETITSVHGECLSSVDLHLHTGINGVLVGMPDHGWGPEELAAFGFKRVFCGHYHNHKAFEVPTPGAVTSSTQIVSIGSLTHQTWGDVGTTAGWVIVDETEFRQTESKAPKFMDFDDSYDLHDYTGNYVRVRGVELEEDEIRTLKDALENSGALGVVIHAVAKSKIVTRNGGAGGKAVKIEQSISTWIEDYDPGDIKSVEKEALDVLNEARGA